MDTANTHYNKRPGSGKNWAGLVLLILGVVLLIRTLGGFVPDWVTSWPMIFLMIGIFTGSRNNFRNRGSLILIFIGTVFLIGRIVPGIEMHDFVFPVLIMGLGLYLILGKRRSVRHKMRERFNWDKRVDEPVTDAPLSEGEKTEATPGSAPFQPFTANDPNDFKEDYIDTVSVFGSIKKVIFSKNFKGGDMVTIMGGAEINLSQADIHGVVIIDITQIFGGTKLIIPPQWKVTSDLAAVFGGIEDKRPLMPAGSIAEEKVLILHGTSIFGGIDIRSF